MKKIFSLAVLLLALTACHHGLEYDPSPRANIEALWTIIDQRYCYLDYKAQTIGLDWKNVRQKYLAQVHPQMSQAQLFEVMSNMLAELQDGHVNLSYAADWSHYWQWHEDFPRNLDPDLRKAYLGHDYKMAASLKYRILPDNIGYVVYESFSDGIGEGNIDAMLHYLRSCNGLIIDIRGNGGGTVTNATMLSEHFCGEKTLVGYSQYKTGPGHSDFSDPTAEYIEPSKGIRWQKTAVVLTNRECYSAANDFVRNMKCMPRVCIMGDNTGGGGGMPFTSELPCGWSVRFSASPSLNHNKQHIEFGIAPDIEAALNPDSVALGYDSIIEAARRKINSGL